MRPFDSKESGFTKTSKTLSNANPNQGLSFPTWGDPERRKINDALAAINNITNQFRGFR